MSTFESTISRDYITEHGVWKVEANALVGDPAAAREMIEEAFNRYIPDDYVRNWRTKNKSAKEQVREHIQELMRTWSFDDLED